jgi:hypothetical protein
MDFVHGFPDDCLKWLVAFAACNVLLFERVLQKSY